MDLAAPIQAVVTYLWQKENLKFVFPILIEAIFQNTSLRRFCARRVLVLTNGIGFDDLCISQNCRNQYVNF